MQVAAVIAAAGSGSRLGRGSKALLELNGRSLLDRALDLFAGLPEITSVVAVHPPGSAGLLAPDGGRTAGVTFCEGGASRQASVHAGLRHASGADFVLVHDAARPLATPELCRRVLAAAVAGGAAFPGLRPADAVRRVEGGLLSESLDRGSLVLAQTPQGFAYPLLLEAHERARREGLEADDDAQLVAALGHPVTLVAGEAYNLKVTTPADLGLVEAILREREAAAR